MSQGSPTLDGGDEAGRDLWPVGSRDVTDVDDDASRGSEDRFEHRTTVTVPWQERPVAVWTARDVIGEPTVEDSQITVSIRVPAPPTGEMASAAPATATHDTAEESLTEDPILTFESPGSVAPTSATSDPVRPSSEEPDATVEASPPADDPAWTDSLIDAEEINRLRPGPRQRATSWITVLLVLAAVVGGALVAGWSLHLF